MTSRKKWTAAEVKYLELNYKICTNKELAETLGRSTAAVRLKLATLGLKRILTPKEKEKMLNEYLQKKLQDEKVAEVSQGYKVCGKCKKVLPIIKFGKNKSKKDGYEVCCKQCKKQYFIEEKSKKRQQEAYERFKESLRPIEEAKERTAKETYTCKRCGKIALGTEFYFNNDLKRRPECKECTNARNKRNALKRILERGSV